MTNKLFAMLLAPVAAVSLAGAAWAASDPIPGVDIIVRKNPGGSSMRTQTGRDGRFVIEGLSQGTYTIRVAGSVDMPRNAARAAINTSRSNIKRPNGVMVNGVEVVTIEAESGQGPAEAVFMIGAQRGRVVGLVTRAGAAPR